MVGDPTKYIYSVPPCRYLSNHTPFRGQCKTLPWYKRYYTCKNFIAQCRLNVSSYYVNYYKHELALHEKCVICKKKEHENLHHLLMSCHITKSASLFNMIRHSTLNWVSLFNKSSKIEYEMLFANIAHCFKIRRFVLES